MLGARCNVANVIAHSAATAAAAAPAAAAAAAGVSIRDALQKRFSSQKIPFPGVQLRDDVRRASLKLARAYVAEVLQVCCGEGKEGTENEGGDREAHQGCYWEQQVL
jgi:hypothetical protein